MVKNSWTPEVRSLMPSRVSKRVSSCAHRWAQGGYSLAALEGVAAASRSIAIETLNPPRCIPLPPCPEPGGRVTRRNRQPEEQRTATRRWYLSGKSRRQGVRSNASPARCRGTALAARASRDPRRAARAFPGLILERRPPHSSRPLASFPFQPTARFCSRFCSLSSLFSEHTQVQPANPR